MPQPNQPSPEQLDEAEAAWRTAAEAGDPDAMNLLGALLATRGSPDAGEPWLRRAAKCGADGAQFNLGRLLEQRGDPEGAAASYRLAAEHGDAKARTHSATCCTARVRTATPRPAGDGLPTTGTPMP